MESAIMIEHILSEFTTEQLYSEIYSRQEIKSSKCLAINQITQSDFQVTIWENISDPPCYGFCLIHGDEVFDIYYDFENQPWWPMIDGENAAFNFIPSEFAEECENYYSCEGNGEEILKSHGFKNFVYEVSDESST